MESIGTILKHPDEFFSLLKLKLAIKHAEKHIPREPHWAFCYCILHKVARSFALVIQHLGPELRPAVAILYLFLRAIDTVEDDMSIPDDVKVPILEAFHRHMYNPDWHFSCGTSHCKVLMEGFHHLSTAFLELGKGHQEAIEDIMQRVGAGMAKFVLKEEVETVDEYEEYCDYVNGLISAGLSNIFHAANFEDSFTDSLGFFIQKTNTTRDYLEDINEIPKPRMFWPHEIWSKYVNKLEDLKNEENSEKAVQCLNDMITNALKHMEDCLKCMAALRDPAIFRFVAITQIMAIGTLALCYNNVEVFRGKVKMRRGLVAKVMDQTRTMSDVYGAFYDYSLLLKNKIDKNDPNATKTLNLVETVQKVCSDSVALNQRTLYIFGNQSICYSTMIFVVFLVLAITISFVSTK